MSNTKQYIPDIFKLLNIEPGKNEYDFKKVIQNIKNMSSNRIPNPFQTEYYLMSLKQDESNNICTKFNHMNLGDTDLIQTSSSPLYFMDNLEMEYPTTLEDVSLINKLLPIGLNSSNVTIYNYNIHNVDNLYNSYVQTVYRLPSGTIGVQHSPKLQHFTDYYALPNNFGEQAPITFGTGNYLNKKGFVIILTGHTTLKLIIVVTLR